MSRLDSCKLQRFSYDLPFNYIGNYGNSCNTFDYNGNPVVFLCFQSDFTKKCRMWVCAFCAFFDSLFSNFCQKRHRVKKEHPLNQICHFCQKKSSKTKTLGKRLSKKGTETKKKLSKKAQWVYQISKLNEISALLAMLTAMMLTALTTIFHQQRKAITREY